MSDGKSKIAFPGATRPPQFAYPPEKFTLVDDPSHPLYDSRVHNPVNEWLVENIMDLGVIEPIIVRKNGPDIVEVVDGRQRVKAALEANRRFVEAGSDKRIEVPFVQRKGTDENLFKVTIAANELRVDDTPLVKAEKAQRLLSYGKTEREVAVTFGVSLPALKNIISLLDLCPEVREALKEGELSATAASKLAPLSRAEQKKRLDAMREQGGKMTAARVEKATRGENASPARRMRTRLEIEKMRTQSEHPEMSEHDKGFAAALDWVLYKQDPATV